MGEESPKSSTQVIEPSFSIGRQISAIFRAAPLTSEEHWALTAITRKGRALLKAKFALLGTAH
jgi:glycyl-tRNA synthetase (class II)